MLETFLPNREYKSCRARRSAHCRTDSTGHSEGQFYLMRPLV